MRRSLLPVALAAALLPAVAGCGGGGARPAPSPPPSTTTTTTTTTTTATTTEAAPPSTGQGLRAVAISPFSVRVAWRTKAPADAWVAAGPPDGPPTIWRHESGPAGNHSLTLGGLAFSTPYRIQVGGVGTPLDVTTAPAPARPNATVRAGVLWVDGNPFFPLMVFEQCPDTYSTSLQVGVNLFAGNRCGGLAAQRSPLAGKALLAATADDRAAAAGGTVGTFFPDEADGHDLTGASLPAPPPGGAGVRFLTLTSHFYSGAAPLAGGRTLYPGLVSKADVVGFDLYPLQGWCQPGRLADVYRAQQELTRLAGGKPTYQWIEAAGMRCPTGPTAVTPATVRAESLLALAGGARGLGFFPAAAWTGDVGAAIAGVTRAVRYLGPGLLGPDVPTGVGPGSPVLVGARAQEEALYVVAVNPGSTPASATVSVQGLDGRPLSVFDEGRTVSSSGDSFTDAFGPLQGHVYVVAPAGS